jgi:hypothetical protein
VSELVKLIDDPAYRRRIVAQLYGDNGSAWMHQAACANEPGAEHDDDYHDSFFLDEVGNRTKLEFPETALRRMRICHTCPVRRECLAQAYEQERHLEAIPGTAPVRMRWTEDTDRYGIRGGVPGRIRERYAHHPNRLEAIERWHQAVARKRRWGLEAVVERLWNRSLESPPKMRESR